MNQKIITEYPFRTNQRWIDLFKINLDQSLEVLSNLFYSFYVSLPYSRWIPVEKES